MTENKAKKLGLEFEVPEGWKVYELGKLVEEKRPISYGIVQTGDPVEGGIPCVRVTDIVDGQIDRSNLITTSKKISDGYKRTQLKKGDLVMALRGKIGQIAKIGDELVGANLTRGVALIALKDSFFNDFILHQISSERTAKVLERNLNGSALQELSIGILRKVPILVPINLHEQRAIAQVLGKMDEAIQTTERLIAQKELRKKWLMQHLLMGKLRLLDQNGRLFEEEWKEQPLKKICKITKGEQLNRLDLDKTGNYPSYSGGISPSGYTNEWNTAENTIIISEGGNSCGYVNFITTKFWSGGHCYSLLELNKIIDRDFLFQTLKFNEPSIMKLRVGSGLPNVQKKDLENYRLLLPSVEEQTAIARVLQTADQEISLLKAKADKLREQKKGMMQLLLTGKVRLKNLEN
ncbi:type I restriction enzyme, S subunit [Algoriphagus faecimaris]|uniref:Type I restriction enzyme, S subunit n=1 Tax=Algoriphagus faecimaris TaxID=686796 RepID=A0A1G6NBH2_9BACT|nr:restriction endonuclease subunit S [Algoriphagus faecimaris]SDC65173.1 type I restriction enzyme, S subunit [Algoriphagus faecimaris]